MQTLEQFVEEMKKFKIDCIKTKDKVFEAERLIQVQLDIDIESKLEFFNEYMLEITTSRKSKFYASFHKNDRSNITIVLTTEMPHGVKLLTDKIIATTFPDFCWILSEGTTNQSAQEVMTKVRENVELGDLTWYLPSKFADDIIEVTHILNHSIVEGLLQDAIMYGPYTH